MYRFSSVCIFVSPELQLKRTVIEQDQTGCIKNFIYLDEQYMEPANTLFVDGIISTQIVSLKLALLPKERDELNQQIQYIELNKDITGIPDVNKMKPFAFDFGTENIDEINEILLTISPKLKSLNIFDLIGGSVYYPSKIAGKPAEPALNNHAKLLVWENIDLPNKKITQKTRIRALTISEHEVQKQ